MNNLPPIRSVDDPPWEQSGPEPSELCPHCGGGLNYRGELIEEDVVLSEWRSVIHHKCPHCNEVVEAYDYDEAEVFLQALRRFPEEMLKEVEEFSELREL